jgi:hypothetical protein
MRAHGALADGAGHWLAIGSRTVTSRRGPQGVAISSSAEVRMVLRIISKPRTETDMTTDKKVARRKLSLLELASDLGNVSKACRMICYSRQQFY